MDSIFKERQVSWVGFVALLVLPELLEFEFLEPVAPGGEVITNSFLQRLANLKVSQHGNGALNDLG